LDKARIRELLNEHDRIEGELKDAMNGVVARPVLESRRKPPTCSTCGEEGHTARNCPRNAPMPELSGPEGATGQ
jgi:hypothetical protein